MGFNDFNRVWATLSDFYRVLPSFFFHSSSTEFCQLSFTEFYRVFLFELYWFEFGRALPSFTEFYRVVPSYPASSFTEWKFTEFYRVFPIEFFDDDWPGIDFNERWCICHSDRYVRFSFQPIKSSGGPPSVPPLADGIIQSGGVKIGRPIGGLEKRFFFFSFSFFFFFFLNFFQSRADGRQSPYRMGPLNTLEINYVDLNFIRANKSIVSSIVERQ